jgi:hypothetical protein
MTLRDEAIAQFRATMELEEVLKGLVARVAQLRPETVLIAWEANGEVDMVTVPHSRLLAKSYADAMYNMLWLREDDEDADAPDDDME